MTRHWAVDHLGTPWIAGTSDCWTFARTIWRQRFGLDVPGFDVDAADPRAARQAFGADPGASGWREVDDRAEGDGVLMAMGRLPCHVGVWIDLPGGGHVLHSVEDQGVVLTPAARLAQMGYRVCGVYRHAGLSCAPM